MAQTLAEEFTLEILHPRLQAKWDAQSEIRGWIAPARAQVVARESQKVSRGFVYPREKMLSIALNASMSDSSKMNKWHHSGGQSKGRMVRRSLSSSSHCTQAPP